MDLPLMGVRVVEIASFVAAPAAGALLADLGATVAKVEIPGGEIYRHASLRAAGHPSDFPESPAFQMDNRGKRSLVLDLKRPVAVRALLRVIDRADVVLTNLLPERRRRFGIDPQTLLARRPELIYASLTGYGSRGPEADAPSFDYAAYWARTGMMHLTRESDETPAYLRPGVGDHAASMSLVSGILAALRVRDRTGRGQAIDVSLLQIGLYILGNDLSPTLVTRENPDPRERRRAPNPLWNQYPTGDGRWLFLVMIDSQSYWPSLCRALDREDLVEDPRFCKAGYRVAHGRELVEILDEIFLSRSLEEWTERLGRERLIWAPVLEPREAILDPQARAMGYFESVDHPIAGRFETVGPPFKMSGTPLVADRPAPELGAHSSEILREAGLTPEEIKEALERS